MKNADEIKKGLECCSDYERQLCGNTQCPYLNTFDCVDTLLRDARSLIRQLESKLNQAVEDMRMLGRIGANICPVCAHHNHGEGSKEYCITCIINRETDNFEWRGAKMDGGAEA